MKVVILMGVFLAGLPGLMAVSSADRNTIVDEHNNYRRDLTNVKAGDKPAANMLKMSWNPTAAAFAQQHVEKCTWGHSSQADRMNIAPEYWYCGENIAFDYPGQPWDVIIGRWYNEVQHFTWGVPTTETIGHFTQIVWADSGTVGCGVTNCAEFSNAPGLGGMFYSCVYCVGGNVNDKTKPYEKGPTCSNCPSGTACNNDLCV